MSTPTLVTELLEALEGARLFIESVTPIDATQGRRQMVVLHAIEAAIAKARRS